MPDAQGYHQEAHIWQVVGLSAGAKAEAKGVLLVKEGPAPSKGAAGQQGSHIKKGIKQAVSILMVWVLDLAERFLGGKGGP